MTEPCSIFGLPFRYITEDYEAVVSQAQRERDAGYQPPLGATVSNINSYDVVFLGFPIWGMTAPPVSPVVPFRS